MSEIRRVGTQLQMENEQRIKKSNGVAGRKGSRKPLVFWN
jgi:hypothetical protein